MAKKGRKARKAYREAVERKEVAPPVWMGGGGPGWDEEKHTFPVGSAEFRRQAAVDDWHLRRANAGQHARPVPEEGS